MKKILAKLMLLSTCLFSLDAQADYQFPIYVGANSTSNSSANHLSLSAKVGKAKLKQGTVHKDGYLYGLCGVYDIVNSNTFYLGAEISYKLGNLKGKARSEDLLLDADAKSKYSDVSGEVRVGFTFASTPSVATPTLFSTTSPYFVLGYEREKDNYVSSTPLALKNKLDYAYVGIGAVSCFSLTDTLSLSPNLKIKYIFNADQKTKSDSLVVDKHSVCKSCFHYQAELPIAMQIAVDTTASLAAFYEYKKYDKHKFNWMGTEKASMHLYGALVNLKYSY